MRNTTKLKIILQKYSVTLDMNADESFVLVLFDKKTNEMKQIEGKNYGAVLAKAYSHILKSLKEETEIK